MLGSSPVSSCDQITVAKRLASRFRPGGIGRQMTWLLLQSGVEAVAMTIASLLVARWFGPAPLGQLAILLAGVQLVTLLGDGFFPTILKYVAEARSTGDPSAANVGFRLVVLSGLILFIAAIITGVVTYIIYGDQLTITLVVLTIALASARGWRSCFDGTYRGIQEFRIPALVGCVCTALTAGSIIVLASAGHKVTMYLSVMVVGCLVNCLLLWRAYDRKYLNQTSSRSSVHIAGFLKYSIPLSLRGLSTFLFLKINVLMLGGIASLSDAGQFRLTDQFLTIPALVLSAALAAIAPRITQAHLGGKPQMELLLSRIYGLMILLTLPLALFFWLNGPLLNLFWPQYAPASRMLTFYAPAMLVIGIGYAASLVPVLAGKPGIAFVLSLCSGLVNVVFAFVGLKLYGVMGLACGSAIVHFFTYAASVVVTHWVFHLKFRVRFL